MLGDRRLADNNTASSTSWFTRQPMAPPEYPIKTIRQPSPHGKPSRAETALARSPSGTSVPSTQWINGSMDQWIIIGLINEQLQFWAG
jgi:hypothetical protein